MTAVTRPALRYHGGKFRLAPWIMQFFPAHTCYVEPFGGAAGVLLQKPRSYAEVYNDLDGDIANFFRVLRDRDLREQLAEMCALTAYARDEWELAWEHTDEPLERARRTVVRAQMGFGSAGATKGKTGFRIDTKREHQTAQGDWLTVPAALRAAGARFAGVLVENRPAAQVITQHDAATTLHFVDPPYVLSTRCLQGGGRTTRGGYYRHELTDDNHRDLLAALRELQGMVVLSGYETDMYHAALPGWTVHRTSARISAGRGTGIRTEVVWLNPACDQALQLERGGLFAEAA